MLQGVFAATAPTLMWATTPPARPFLYCGKEPEDMPAMVRLLVVGNEAWTLDLLRAKRKIVSGDLVFTIEDARTRPSIPAPSAAGARRAT